MSQWLISVRVWPSLGSSQVALSRLVGGWVFFFLTRMRGMSVMGFFEMVLGRSGESGMMAKSAWSLRSFSGALLGEPVSRVRVILGWAFLSFFNMSGSMVVLAVTEQKILRLPLTKL